MTGVKAVQNHVEPTVHVGNKAAQGHAVLV